MVYILYTTFYESLIVPFTWAVLISLRVTRLLILTNEWMISYNLRFHCRSWLILCLSVLIKSILFNLTFFLHHRPLRICHGLQKSAAHKFKNPWTMFMLLHPDFWALFGPGFKLNAGGSWFTSSSKPEPLNPFLWLCDGFTGGQFCFYVLFKVFRRSCCFWLQSIELFQKGTPSVAILSLVSFFLFCF